MGLGPQLPESLIGRVIAGYELTDFIAAGASGQVFRGKRTASAPALLEKTGVVPTIFPDDAAVKLLDAPARTQKEREDFENRFDLEGRLLKQLDHPHILPLVDSGKDKDLNAFYMILPYMAGGSLAEVIRAQGPLPLARAETILAQIADALDYAHGKDIVHRDVKPGNILLDAAGKPYLADFGIVRLLSESADAATQHTTTGRMMGSFAYMAPEQFDDSSRVGPAADTYSLGMVAYEMVTGKVAFGASSLAQVMKQQLQETPTPPRSIRNDLPEPAEAAIMKALAKDPEQRFASGAEFARAFALGVRGKWAEGLTRFVAPAEKPSPADSAAQTQPNAYIAGGAPPVGLAHTGGGGSQRNRLLAILGVAAALLLIMGGAAGAVFATRGQSPGTSSIAQIGSPSASVSTARATATHKSSHSGGGTSGGTVNNPPTATPHPTNTPRPPTATPKPAPMTYSEQEGHYGADAFLYYHNASGKSSTKIAAGQWVQVSCKVYDPTIQSVNPDGYWYRIASSPWNNQYYAAANTFMNGDPWNGPYTHNTDFSVPNC